VGHWLPDWHPGEDHTTSYAARPELGGGVALTLIHEVQMALGWLGPAERVVGAFPRSELLPLEVDTIADLMIHHAGGGVSQLHLDFIQRPWHREGVLCCERGWIRYDLAATTVTARADGDAEPAIIRCSAGADPAECYDELMATFLRFVREGRMRHPFDAWQGCLALGVVDAARRSAEEDRWIELPGWIRKIRA
jgi:predicted dehydrogenase